MPFPAVAGIPWLAGIVGGLFASLFSFFVRFFTKRLAIVAAAVTIIVSTTAAFFSALHALIAGVGYVLPDGFSNAFALIMPDNTVICISAMITAKLLRFGYDWSVKIIQYKLF